MTAMTSRAAVEARLSKVARLSPLQALRSMGNYALHYARQGVPVFPLAPGTKLPLLKSPHDKSVRCRGECGEPGHGFHDATTREDWVTWWWRKHPMANIGTPTGVLFDVLDIDGAIGYESYEKIVKAGLLPETTYGSIWTPKKGGLHVLLRPSGEGRSIGILPGVDGLGQNGFSVLPPTVITDYGTYTWLEEPDFEGLRHDPG